MSELAETLLMAADYALNVAAGDWDVLCTVSSTIGRDHPLHTRVVEAIEAVDECAYLDPLGSVNGRRLAHAALEAATREMERAS